MLPQRYDVSSIQQFNSRALDALYPGVRVLDVGSGSRPSIASDQRPRDCEYVGLDIQEHQLLAAPLGSYSKIYVADLSEHVSELAGCFDFITACYVFEHVSSLDRVLANIHGYLRDEGRLLALVAGRYSLPSVLNRVLPDRAGAIAMKRLLNRDPDSVFHAHYHHCLKRDLSKDLRCWTSSSITPIYAAAQYLRFSNTLQRIYLVYEDWIAERRYSNLATEYIVEATK